MEKNKSDFSWKTLLSVGGAFAAYHIGSGFASGQEVLQFFGSWGGAWAFITPLIPMVFIFIYAVSTFRSGMLQSFENPSDAYVWYCGKWVSKFMDIFSIIMIAGIGLVMFSGCGATLQQYLGVPQYVGAVGLGIIAVFVVWFGLEKVTDVLGVSGIIIIGFVVAVGIYTMVTSDVSLLEAEKNVPQYAAEGKILQASLFGIKSPVVAGLFYGGMTLLDGFPFMIALSRRIKSKKEVVGCAATASVLFTLGVMLVSFTVLMEIDYVIESGAQVPMLAIVSEKLPWLSLPFTIVIVAGIFTTIVGYLWIIGRRFAPDKSTKQRIIIVVTALVGIFAGSVIPFGTIINVLYPFAGCVGVVLFVIVVVNDFVRWRRSKKALPQA